MLKRHQEVSKWTINKKGQHKPKQIQFTILNQHSSFTKQACYS